MLCEHYEKSYQIELLTEFSSGVYAEALNLVLEQNLDPYDTSHFDVQVLQQLGEMKRVNLFNKSIDELKKINNYWKSMSHFVQSLEGVQ